MKAEIPEEFKIGATTAHIEYTKHLRSDEGYSGTYNQRTGILQIESHLVGAKRDRTLGHELMEVIKENYSLSISENDMTCIANGWLEFLQQLNIEFDWGGMENARDTNKTES